MDRRESEKSNVGFCWGMQSNSTGGGLGGNFTTTKIASSSAVVNFLQ